MDTITNQAAGGPSSVWSAIGADYDVISDINGSGMDAFNREFAGQWINADVQQPMDTGGTTIVWLVKPLTGVSGNVSGVHTNTSNINWGGIEILTTNVIHVAWPRINSTVLSTGTPINGNAWNLMITTVPLSATAAVYCNTADVTKGAPGTYDGANNSNFNYAFSGSNSGSIAHHALIMVYGEVLSLENINNVGNWASDRFGLSQTWALS